MRKLNVADGHTDGRTDGRGALQYLPSRASGAAGDKNQGHLVFMGLCIILNVLLDSRADRPRGLLLIVGGMFY